jgi:hypothetical protein
VIQLGARQRLRPNAENVGEEVSWRTSRQRQKLFAVIRPAA